MFRLLQPYFGHFSCVSFGYVCNMQSSRSAYNLNQSVVEKLLSFVKLVLRGGTAPLQIETGRYISISGEVCCFFDLTHLPLESSNWFC